MGNLTALRELIVVNNDLTCPPMNIIMKGCRAMISHLKILLEGGDAPEEIVIKGKFAVEAFYEWLDEGRKTQHMKMRAQSLHALPIQVLDIDSLTSMDASLYLFVGLPDDF